MDGDYSSKVMLELFLAVNQFFTFVISGFVATYAMRAYRRTSAPALGSLAIGFGCLAIGAMVAFILFAFTNVALLGAVTTQVTATTIGVAFIAYSLYAGGPDDSADYEIRYSIQREP